MQFFIIDHIQVKRIVYRRLYKLFLLMATMLRFNCETTQPFYGSTICINELKLSKKCNIKIFTLKLLAKTLKVMYLSIETKERRVRKLYVWQFRRAKQSE